METRLDEDLGRQQQGEETWLSEPTTYVSGGVADDLLN